MRRFVCATAATCVASALTVRQLSTSAAASSIKPLDISVGLACCPKKTPKLNFNWDPKDLKAWWANRGEDAFFIEQNETITTIGVLDGVGGWASKGVDPAVFSGALAQSCAQVARTKPNAPNDIIHEGYLETIKKVAQLGPGSTTICVASFDRTAHSLKVSNYGDSGLRRYTLNTAKKYKLKGQTREQQHYFNCPFQLSSVARHSLPDPLILETDQQQMDIDENTIVVMATDGIFDNLYDSVIETILSDNSDASVSVLATLILQEAHHTAQSPTAQIPFTDGLAADLKKKGQRITRADMGGKDDDLTVVVVRFSPGNQLKSKL